nr:PREDICTED: IAA-alanine resistance protein 1 [Daucus carota subsp. sativus]XP_017231797.1 PREDICTED: IAA-alanine resistance protein 1 [Daucus carota subsp. sativus]
MGCSLLVSLASLICLIILPLIFVQGKPSKTIVDALAVFGAGAMLGDAFLHQLPHAFGGDHTHSHDHQMDHGHHVHSENGHSHSHSHSIQDLSVGLSILAGIVLFLLVEKVVRYVDDVCGEANAPSHGHHHHHRKSSKKLKDDKDATDDDLQVPSVTKKGENLAKGSSEGTEFDKITDDCANGERQSGIAVLRKRNITTGGAEEQPNMDDVKNISSSAELMDVKKLAESPSNLVFGYLNLFSDGVHNFTDGVALGSAFLLYGSVGGWSRTLFLLAHELPQEIGDFGILVRSGFSVSAALSFNFLSALAALAGTALALMWGQDPGQSSLIEGFTAGGFIYIAVAGVLAEMNNGSSSLRSTAIQLTSLILGMTVALFISLYE